MVHLGWLCGLYAGVVTGRKNCSLSMVHLGGFEACIVGLLHLGGL